MTIAPQSTAHLDKAALRAAWRTERDAARAARRTGDTSGEWARLERAHILSQPLAGAHLRTHGAMLSAAIRRLDPREMVGQVTRVLLAVPGSISGRYPVGNTGGADVSAFGPMEIPEDLRPLLASIGGAK
jgi:hypothetical protein